MDNLLRLHKVGLKATSPRLRIIELFETGGTRHLAADDIYKKLLAEGFDVGQSTIYRALAQLEQAGVLRKSKFASDKSVYELDDGPHHDHLICIDCGHITEFTDVEIERHQEKIAEELGFHLAEHALSIYCHCTRKNCELREMKVKLRIRRDERAE